MTIIITISRGLITRNILQNEFYELIKKRFSKVVILTTAADDQRFIDEFKAKNVEIIPLLEYKPTFLSELISRLNIFLIYNINTVKLSLYNTINPKNRNSLYIKYLILRIIFQPLSKITVLRRVLRYLDYLLIQKDTVNEYSKIIKKYKPAIIFCTNMMEEPDVSILKAARKERILSMGMCKSWDNPSKVYFRAKVDKMIVWSSFMKEQMKVYQDYKDKDVKIVGIPQFDYYLDESRLISRQDFCKKFKLNPDKKILLFGSEGKLVPTEPNVVEIILDFIDNNELIKQCQVLIRPHFGYKKDYLKFNGVLKKENIAIDLFNNPSSGFRDQWDYSQEQMNNFLNMIYHSDIIINTCSTLTLDAAAIKKPVILIKFDGYEKLPLYKSAARWYYSDYYSKILEYGAALEANKTDELKQAINKLLRNPNLLKKQQQKLIEHFCYKVDGQSGQRLFKVIEKYAK